jgi:hypothetical protein
MRTSCQEIDVAALLVESIGHRGPEDGEPTHTEPAAEHGDSVAVQARHPIDGLGPSEDLTLDRTVSPMSADAVARPGLRVPRDGRGVAIHSCSMLPK